MQPARIVDVSAPAALSLDPRNRPGWARRSLGVVGSLILPAAAAMLALRYLLPSRLAGTDGGVSGALAWVGDHHPLFLGLALFLMISETGRHWWKRFRKDAAPPLSQAFAMGGSRRVLVSLAAVVLLAFALRGSVAATYRVVGPSMLPTLEIGDRVLVNRLAYGLSLPLAKTRATTRPPQHGDLVVFRANGLAGADGPQSVVKRVIGLPGDRVAFEAGACASMAGRFPPATPVRTLT